MDTRSPSSSEGQRRLRLSARDRDLLAFIAEHRFVLLDHARVRMGISARAASARLGALWKARLLRRTPLLGGGSAHSITSRGLAAIGSRLPVPKPKLHSYEHDVGVAWLWLAAARGAFGELEQVIGERAMRSHDAFQDRVETFAVRLGGVGPSGAVRLHFPDLLLITSDQQRMALELELSEKSRTRRELILSGYASDARIDSVLYFVSSPSLARSVRSSARKLAITDRLHVQHVHFPSEERICVVS